MLVINPLIMMALLLLSSTSLLAQVCKPDVVDPSTPTKKYILNGDGTFTDKKNKLMWTQCVRGVSGEQCDQGTALKVDWKEAQRIPYKLNQEAGFAGQTDWYLPNIEELETMLEVSCYDPTLNPDLFPNAPTTTLWSRSLDGDDPTYAWGINLYNGNQYFSLLKHKAALFLVRSTEKKKKKKKEKKK